MTQFTDPSGSSAGEEEPHRIHTGEIAMACSYLASSVRLMSTKHDPKREAEAAMKRAAAAEGPDRQRLIQLALAWHELAREPRQERAD